MTGIKALPLVEDQLCFALYSASRAITARYRTLLERIGLTYPQYLVMMVLWESGPMPLVEMGRRLELDSGTLSPLLKRLQVQGLLTRTRRSDDERSVLIELTTAGQSLREQVTEFPAAICSATGLSLRQVNDLVTTLREVSGNIRGSSPHN